MARSNAKENSNEPFSKKRNLDTLRDFTFLTSAFIGRVCQGFFTAVFSPTLLYLAENLNVDVLTMSPIFVGRSVGFMLAAICAGYFLEKKIAMPVLGFLGRGLIDLVIDGDPGSFYTTICFLMLVCAVCVFVVPLVTSVGLLVFLVTLSGMAVGFLDAALQGIILNVWGEKNSRMYIQIYHFAFTVGAVIAPLVAKPFLEAASLTTHQEDRCPRRNETQSFLKNHSISTIINSTTEKEENDIDPVSNVFYIGGTFSLALALFYVFLAYFGVTTKIKKQRIAHNSETEQRPEDAFKEIYIFYFLITLFYFCLAGCEQTFISFVYPVAVCSRLKFSASNASILNSLFWGGFMIARLGTAFSAKLFRPRSLVLFFLVGSVLSSALMASFGEDATIVSWVSTFLFGFFIGPIYPSFVSWISQSCNISGKYISIVNVGTGIGIMALTPIVGVVFQQNPFATIYFILGFCIITSLIFFVLMLYERKHQGRKPIKDGSLVAIEADTKENEKFFPDKNL